MKSLSICIIGFLFPLLAFSQIKLSTVQRAITYQGVLTDGAGNPVADNYYLITFRVYDAATNGAELWTEAQTLPTIKGQFNAILGSTTPLQLAFDKQYWLGVTVATGPEMVPRTALTPTPYSFRAFNADSASTVNGFTASATPTPRKLLALDSTGKFPASAIPGGGTGGGSGSPIYVTTAGAYAVRGENTAAGNGVQGSSKDGIGILGTSQNDLGIKATTQNGVTALEAVNTKANGNAITAQADNGTSSIAIDAISAQGCAIQATSSSGSGVVAEGRDFAVYGVSTTGTGIYGEARVGVEGSGAYSGVFGSGGRVGVEGRADSLNTYGVYGSSHSGVGVNGATEHGTGVSAVSFTGTALRVMSGGSAAHLQGDAVIIGTLTKTAGSFRIDHPLDPANKYLQHSFVESPDMKNIYDGVTTLDVNGEAVVRLPDYFEALNTGFRYQLTCIGGYAPVYVASKISGNSFRIAGGKPGLEVSWMVTGSRQDAYAQAHPIVTELPKSGREAGTYLHPVEHGAPESMGTSYEEIKRAREFLTLNNVTKSGPSLREDASRSTQQKERPKIIRRNQPVQDAADATPREIKEK